MSAQASASRSVSLATAAEQVYAAIVDPDRYGVWCTLHRSWSQRPEHLDDTATSAETIAILDRPTEITWAVDPKAGPSTVIRHGEGPRNLRATMSLTAEAADGGTTVTFAAEFSSPAFDDDLASAIAQWTDAALVLSLARLQDVASGAAPRESVEVGADTETFLDGLGFTECPRWRDGCLYLVDMVQHLVLRVEIDGSVTTLATVEATPGGLGWLPDGTLLVVSQRDGKILRIGGSGELTVHADLSAQITSPLNDMWVGPDGRAYVGEMGFDVHAVIQQTGGPGGEIKPGALFMVEPDGCVRRVADDVSFPNGIMLSADGKTLYVAESLVSQITAFDVGADGRLGGRRTHAELPYVPDGIAVDRDGYVWFATPAGKLTLRVAPDGTVVDEVHTQLDSIAVGLGGDDGRTLFCCTSPTNNHAEAAELLGSRVETVRVDTPGW